MPGWTVGHGEHISCISLHIMSCLHFLKISRYMQIIIKMLSNRSCHVALVPRQIRLMEGELDQGENIICSSCNSSPHSCTTHLPNSFPLFHTVSVLSIWPPSICNCTAVYFTLTFDVLQISLRVISRHVFPLNRCWGEHLEGQVGLHNLLECHWHQLAVHSNDLAPEISFQFSPTKSVPCTETLLFSNYKSFKVSYDN